MKWLVFQSPRKPTDRAIKELDYEPNEFIMQCLAMKFGNILVLSEEDLLKELQ
jgi:3'-phosphoadenosine 5'-phosphosulfate (PAPS) 3'-phosphatase